MDIGPRTPREYQIFPHIEPLQGRVSGEQILCGRGLVNTYRAVAKADGKQPRFTSRRKYPPQRWREPIRRRGGARPLRHLPRPHRRRPGAGFQEPGRRVPDRRHRAEDHAGAKTGNFRAAFEDKAPHSELMATIPAYVITHPLAALAGLAAYAREPSKFDVETSGRRWRG